MLNEDHIFHYIAPVILSMQNLPLEILLINLPCHFPKSLRLQTVDNNFEKFVGQRFFKFTYEKIKSILCFVFLHR